MDPFFSEYSYSKKYSQVIIVIRKAAAIYRHNPIQTIEELFSFCKTHFPINECFVLMSKFCTIAIDQFSATVKVYIQVANFTVEKICESLAIPNTFFAAKELIFFISLFPYHIVKFQDALEKNHDEVWKRPFLKLLETSNHLEVNLPSQFKIQL